MSNYDFQASWIGASRECIDHLVASEILEVLELDPSHTLNDTINPEPEGTATA